jgi:hypothetical protein
MFRGLDFPVSHALTPPLAEISNTTNHKPMKLILFKIEKMYISVFSNEPKVYKTGKNFSEEKIFVLSIFEVKKSNRTPS